MLSWRDADAPVGERLLWLGDRWLLAGHDGRRAATWTSRDGLSWEPGAPIDPAGSADYDRPSRYWISDVIEHDGSLLAVGWNLIGIGDGGRAVSWSSADGERWTFHDPTDTTFGAMYHFPSRLAHGPSGEVVLLSVTGLGSGNTIFVTNNGRRWEERPVAQWETTSMTDLVGSDKLLMAVGVEIFAGPVRQPLVYLSTDATTWIAGTIPPGAGDLSAVTYDPVRDRFLVVGTDERDRPMAWLTEDGRRWASTRLADQGGGVADIAANERGLIAAVGSASNGAVAWTSHDGITWSINEFGVERLSIIGVGPTVVVGAGWPQEGRIWVGAFQVTAS